MRVDALVVIGPDGLPHCRLCRADALCPYHTAQVTGALNGLMTARVLARETDVAPLLRSRRLGRRMDGRGERKAL